MKIQVIGLALVLLLLGGCVPPVPRTWTAIPQPESLVTQLRLTGAGRQRIDTEAHVSVTMGGRYLATQQFLLAEKNSRLRADVLTGFGQLIMQVAVDDNWLSAFVNTTVPGKYYQGYATEENLSRFVRIPLQVSDLVSFLLYAPPVISYNSATVSARQDELTLRLDGGEQRQEVVFDPALRATTVRYYRAGTLQLEVTYGNFMAGANFPKSLKIDVPERDVRIKVAMEQPLINPDISVEKFRISAPVGAQLEIL